MDIHDFIFLLVKNIAYFIFWLIISALIAGIAKIISLPLIIVAIILILFQYFAIIWMGYLNTKDSKDHKLKNGLIFHVIWVVLVGILSSFYDDQSLWEQLLDTLLLFGSLEIGSLIYYFKKRKKVASAV
ncbi:MULTISPECIES: hypothetical protein [unclassified Acinetobacter]|jgi:hypothetical protein|uniref:hypothetical protein n=2 Tax=Acinetobacter TaxID=469 RepID=UPI0018AA5B98|nr:MULTISPECIES: hypothetical protein [unclassified Acinetobacter]MBJ9954156.1 hypothetical protein [Acinetobacter baumannii]